MKAHSNDLISTGFYLYRPCLTFMGAGDWDFYTSKGNNSSHNSCWGCCCSVAQLCPTLCDPMDCSTPGFPVLHYLPRFVQTHVHWVDDAIQPSHPLLYPSPPAFYLSQHQGIFQWVNSCIRWPKNWSFSFSISPSNEYPGLISFSIDWYDLLAGQGTLKSLLKHHSLKASILWPSAFFIVQLSHPFMTTGKTIVWLYKPLLAKWCLCFLIHCLRLS